jgi:site-specific DNA recombinase
VTAPARRPRRHRVLATPREFEAVQAKLAANAVERRLQRRESASPLTSRIFDDRGNRMSRTHANKRGARYRYYVSYPILQGRTKEAGSVIRVPPSEIEALVITD